MVSFAAAAVALAVRYGLAAWGIGRHLAWRPEVSSAANSNLELREGLALVRLGASPYSGSAVRVPPLALWLSGPVAEHELLYALPNALLDLLAASLLHQLASHLLKRSSQGKRNPIYGPGGQACGGGGPWLGCIHGVCCCAPP
jgi:phosphatidylinositol glycan class U